MRKKLSLFLCLCLAALIPLGLTACNSECKHTATGEWQNDSERHWKDCADCGHTVDEGEHSFSEWEVETPATCTEAGVRTRTCSVCGYSQTQSISVVGHSFGEWVQTSAPSCTEEGVQQRKCTVCGETEEQHIPVIEHDYEWTVTKEASCSEEGEKVGVCRVCEHEVTETIDTTEHSYDVTHYVGGEEGHWYECSVCHAHKEDSLQEHSYGSWTVDKEADYTTEGERHRECSVCGYVDTQIIPVLKAVESITVTAPATEMNYDGQLQLSVTFNPSDATEQRVTWSCSDEDIAIVTNNGLLMGAGTNGGTVTVTATSAYGDGTITDSVEITVIVPEKTVSIEGDNFVSVGGTVNLSATVLPETATIKTVTWSTEDDTVSVENGVVTGLKEGVATVTATTAHGRTATFTLTVLAVNLDGQLNEDFYDTRKVELTTAARNVADETCVVIGETGLYITHKVTDANVVEGTSRLEVYLSTKAEKQLGSLYYFRYYSDGSIRTFTYNGGDIVSSTNTYPWTEQTGENKLGVMAEVYLTTTGYNVETYIPYSVIGLDEAPETIWYLPVLHFVNSGNNISAFGDRTNMPQANFYLLDNFLIFDTNGYVYKNIDGSAEVSDLTISRSQVADGYYTAQVTLKSWLTATADTVFALPITGLNFGAIDEYVTDNGNGTYTIAVPFSAEDEYTDGVVIEVSHEFGVLSTFTFTIDKTVRVVDITVNGENNVVIGSNITLNVAFNPEEPTDTTIVWTSEDETVATVENGVVTGLKEGVVTITATSADGPEASVRIFVTAEAVDSQLGDLYEGNLPLTMAATQYGGASIGDFTNPIKNETRVAFGEGGVYITYEVADKFIGKNTRIEMFFSTDGTKSTTTMYSFRLYVADGRVATYRYNGNETANFPWSEVTGDNYIENLTSIKTTADGYFVECLIPYEAVGIQSKLENFWLLPITCFYTTAELAAAGGNTNGASLGNRCNMPQATYFTLINYLIFDEFGYLKLNNDTSTYGVIDSDLTVLKNGATLSLSGDNYEATVKFTSSFVTPYRTLAPVAGLDLVEVSEYVTYTGSGNYKISIPKDSASEFAGTTVTVQRHGVKVGEFTLNITL